MAGKANAVLTCGCLGGKQIFFAFCVNSDALFQYDPGFYYSYRIMFEIKEKWKILGGVFTRTCSSCLLWHLFQVLKNIKCIIVLLLCFFYHLCPTCSLTAVVRLLERSQATSPQFWLPPHTTALCDLSRFPCQTPSPSPHQQKVSSSTCCPLLTHSTYSTANTALPHRVVAHARNTLDCVF